MFASIFLNALFFDWKYIMIYEANNDFATLSSVNYSLDLPFKGKPLWNFVAVFIWNYYTINLDRSVMQAIKSFPGFNSISTLATKSLAAHRLPILW